MPPRIPSQRGFLAAGDDPKPNSNHQWNLRRECHHTIVSLLKTTLKRWLLQPPILSTRLLEWTTNSLQKASLFNSQMWLKENWLTMTWQTHQTLTTSSSSGRHYSVLKSCAEFIVCISKCHSKNNTVDSLSGLKHRDSINLKLLSVNRLPVLVLPVVAIYMSSNACSMSFCFSRATSILRCGGSKTCFCKLSHDCMLDQ